MKSRWVQWARQSITAKVYLQGLVILMIGIVVLTGTAWAVADSQAQARIDGQIQFALDTYQHDLSEELQSLAPLGTWLTAQSSLGQWLQDREDAKLDGYLDSFIESKVVDAITIADAHGMVVARLRAGQPITRGDNILSEPGVSEALAGVVSNGMERDARGSLQARHIAPVYISSHAAPVGVLILSYDLDGELLKYWSGINSSAFAVVYQDHVALSNLDDVQGKPMQGQQARSEITQAERNGTSTPLFALDTNQGKYLFEFKPLQSPIRTTIGMLGVGVPMDTLEKERFGLFGAFAVGLLAVIVTMSLAGLVFARSFTFPIRFLSSAVQSIATGDLSTPVVLNTHDELGDLAQHLDHMRQQLQRVIESSSQLTTQYAAALLSMDVAAVMTDRENSILLVNQAAEHLLGQDQSNLKDKPWHTVFDMDQNRDGVVPLSWSKGMQPPNAGPRLVVHGRFPLRTRRGVMLDVVSVPVQIGDELAGYIHTLRDVSAEDKYSQTKEDFVLNVGHELRSPLASLRVSIDLLLEDYGTMSKRDIGVMLRTLQKIILRFQGLTESLVDVGNVQAGRFRVRPAVTSLERLIHDAMDQTQSLWEGKGQVLETRLEAGNATVLADPPRITQVLLNLLTNANKYGPENRPVVLSTWRDGDYVHVSVTDEGIGIPPEEQTHVFERFFRAKRVEEEGAGIGVGLALVKAIVEAHGGKIYLKSGPGEGTTFGFSLPRAQLAGNEWSGLRPGNGRNP